MLTSSLRGRGANRRMAAFRKFFWFSVFLSCLGLLLGIGLESHFSCVGNWKSYRNCLVEGVDIAGTVYGLQAYSMLYLFYCAPIVGAALLAMSLAGKSRQPEHVDKARLAFIAILLGVVSAFVFYWWIVAYALRFARLDAVHPLDEAAKALSESNFRLLFFTLRLYLSDITGLLGWIALWALCIYAKRDWISLPRWIPIGCSFGVVSVLIGPFPVLFSIPPILLATSLLLLVKLNTRHSNIKIISPIIPPDVSR